MKRSIIVCAVGGVLLPVLASAAPLPYYVSATGSAHTQAGAPIATIGDDHSFDTGQLMQAQAGGSQSAGVQSPYDNGQFIELTSATGSVKSSAEIGALHAFVTANSDTGLFHSPYLILDPGDAESRSTAQAIWSDTVHFRSANPNGSDFVWLLSLEDSVSAGGSFYGSESGFYAASAQAVILFTQANFDTGGGLVVDDRYTIYSSGLVIDFSPPQRLVSMTFHANFGQEYFATLTGRLTAGASAINGTGQATADASNTALFGLYSADPLASYDTTSGTVFATTVPEPTSLTAFAAVCIALGLRRTDKRRC